VTIGARTPLRGIVLAVGRALAEHGIRAVLTGGACASLHAAGSYLSDDLDFVLAGRVAVAELDRAMASLGFVRQADRYLHPQSDFWVEFPRGPLAVGGDLDVDVIEWRGRGGRASALSATDSCRDRLAAFYHWNDRQSLDVAVAIAARNEVDLGRIRRWSEGEGHAARFAEFARELSARRARRRRCRRQADEAPRARRRGERHAELDGGGVASPRQRARRQQAARGAGVRERIEAELDGVAVEPELGAPRRRRQ